ncbi:MAG: DNA gyrase subunit B [Ignavibacteria bacterium GWF2_33_9]|nr:MAG: DNA gyrase subunit B [Ignavibacteria bacterium GWF2_33_9]
MENHNNQTENLNPHYNEDSIKVLEGLEAVRKRPAMYIGDIGERGLHHLIQEVVDNSIDEALAGYCTNIIVTLHKDGSCSVYDDGRGIPVGPHPVKKISTLEVVMCTLHAGGKFDKSSYKVSGGLHGVGVSCVNALSSEMKVVVYREGKSYQQKYEMGKPVTKVEEIGNTRKTGTLIRFSPDETIFKTVQFKFSKVTERLRELAFLNPAVTINLHDEAENKSESFHYEGGLVDFINYIDVSSNKHTKPISIFGTAANDAGGEVQVEICLQYNDGFSENVISYVNNINTIEGGTHVTGFRTALTRTLNTYASDKMNGSKVKVQLTGEDFKEGLSAIISIKVPEPQFEGQTKTKLGNGEVEGMVRSIVAEKLDDYLEQNPNEAKRIIEKAAMAAEARLRARQARDMVRRKNALENTTLPGKLADCSSSNPLETEIYIVEGDSAGGSAKQGRDRKFQAILPLKGKILNVEKARMHKILENEEIRTIIQALGTGFAEDFDIAKLRYGKIILMADADVDGAHIKTLLLTLIYNYMRDLIVRGNLFIAMPPLYKVKKSKKEVYCYNEEEREKAILEFQSGDPKAKILTTEDYENMNTDDNESENEENAVISEAQEINMRGISISRFKGLGEMNPEQLWETTMNPDTRTLMQVSIGEAAESARIFQMLMGDKVEPRREFIEANAKYVKNLDT